MYFFIFVGSRFNTYLNTKETQLQKTLIINTFAPILYCYFLITAKENYTKALQSINKTHILESDLNLSENLIFSTLYKKHHSILSNNSHFFTSFTCRSKQGNDVAFSELIFRFRHEYASQ